MSALPLLAAAAAAAPGYLRYDSLGLSPVALDLGWFQLRWYSLAYIAGILVGWWYLLRLLDRPGAPMARRHVDDLVFYVTIGILAGGRLGYAIFYDPALFTSLQIFKLWEGGMSFHGGAAGSVAAVWVLARKHGLSALRIVDYIGCCAPFGLFFGRLANFVNGELWGRTTDVPWGIVFPSLAAGPLPRHPSQLYEAALEGIVLFALLAFAFWRTPARYQPGRLLGLFLIGYGLARFTVEFFREPDAQLGFMPWGLTMGQTLTLPMILVGLWFFLTAPGRRQRVEPVAGVNGSVA
ncbi:MAG: prolipoprotein diacylglyceryl transferase [Sphingomonas fennica]